MVENKVTAHPAIRKEYLRKAFGNYLKLVEKKHNKILNKNPHNSTDSETIYKAILKPYSFNSASDKQDSDKKNTHWKAHLNVLPEHVDFVSKYLKDNNYDHKYLSGGDISDGKIFTVYVGSLKLITKLAKKLSSDLEGKLCGLSSNNNHEFELEPGVAVRFHQSPRPEGWTRYGSKGFPTMATKFPPVATNEDIERSFNLLMEKYGSFFFDNNLVK